MPGKKLTVLFDASPIIAKQRSGVGYYAEGVLKALAETYPDDITIICHCFNFLGRADLSALPSAPNITYVQSRFIHPKVQGLLRRYGLQLPLSLLIRRRGDIAFFPNFVLLLTARGIKTAVVIHDLCFEDMPQFIQARNLSFLKRFVPSSVAHADLVVTISTATKQAVVDHYHPAENKLLVTPIPLAPMPTPSDKPPIAGEYILYMGTLEPRKNFMALVRSYVALPATLKSRYSLVLAGASGWHIENDLAEIKRLQDSGEKIVLPGYVTAADRSALYKNATLFVMPSFYEGFGMPLLEAMGAGAPVLASDIPVFHEVAGDAALYFDLNDDAALTNKLIEYLNSEPLRLQLAAAGKKQLTSYSWQDVARTLYEAFIKL